MTNNTKSLNEKLEKEVSDKLGQEVIGREACIFACLDFRGIKKSLQKSSLELQLKQLAPFEQFETYFIWKNEHVMAWIWSSNKNTNTPPVNTNKYIPETLLLGEQHHSKPEIIQVNKGYEARLWRDELLVGSQYWPSLPTIDEWNNFLRNHSMESQEKLPEILAYSLNDTPWYQPHIIEIILNKCKTINFSLLIATVFFTFLAYSYSGLVRINQKLVESENQYSIALSEANDIVTARNNAIQQLSIINQINNLSNWPSQIELLATCNHILHQLSATLIGWKFDDGELHLVIKTNNSDPTVFISSFESSKLFNEVNLGPQGNDGALSLHMKLRPLNSTQSFSSIIGDEL